MIKKSNHITWIVTGALLMFLSVALLVYDRWKATVNLVEAQQNLLEITENLRTVQLGLPDVSQDERELSSRVQQARNNLDNAMSRVLTRKANILGRMNVYQQPSRQQSLVQAQDALNRLHDEMSAIFQGVLELNNTVTEAERAYDARIVELQTQLNNTTVKQDVLSIEKLVALFGLLAGISTMIIAWRADARENTKLRIELEKWRNEQEPKA